MLETAYYTEFPKATVQRTIFMKGAFHVHQLMVGASDFVLVKLICDAPESPVFEVDYVVPRNVYEAKLRAIESSIGSINIICATHGHKMGNGAQGNDMMEARQWYVLFGLVPINVLSCYLE